jgi:hypothetical protein
MLLQAQVSRNLTFYIWLFYRVIVLNLWIWAFIYIFVSSFEIASRLLLNWMELKWVIKYTGINFLK